MLFTGHQVPTYKGGALCSTLAFCKGALQADVDNVLASSRITGATVPIEGHRVVRKKRPLTVAQVADLKRWPICCRRTNY